MKIERVRADRTPDLGEIDLTLAPGLVGWSGGTARDRRLFADLLRRAMEGDLEGVGVELSVAGEVLDFQERSSGSGRAHDLRGTLESRLRMSIQALVFAWTGGGWTEPEPLWRAGARLLATRQGLPRLEEALTRLGGSPARPGGPAGPPEDPEPSGAAPDPGTEDEGGKDVDSAGRIDPAMEAELATVSLRLEELADVPERLRSLESELRSLRADAAEVVGDLEVATMEWLRERQDAETHLQQYRDQARELRSRMQELEKKGSEGSCPYCGRPLGDHLDDVMAELEDEWDSLVQDGTWWRRRRDQLELKPDDLQELERRAVQLQAEVEDRAERLERCRFELREWDELRGRREELAALVEERVPADRGSEAVEPGTAGQAGAAAGRRRSALIRALRGARGELLEEEGTRLLRSAGSLLNRISGGRILGLMDQEGGRLGILEDGRIAEGVLVEDRAAATVALHLALSLELVDAGVPLESVLVTETFRGMDPEARLRSVDVLRGLRDRIPQIFLLWGGGSVDAVPERFDRIIEFRPHRDRPSVRLLPGGVGRMELVGR